MPFGCFILAAWMTTQGATPKLSEKPDLRCGGHCLYVALRAVDTPIDSLESLERIIGEPSRLGYSMDQLEQAALKCGAKTLGVQTTLDHLSRRKERFACIALLEKTGHFVLIYDVEPKKVHIVDPPRTREMARDAFQSLWNGKALLISTQPLGPLDEPGISPWVYVMVGVPCVLIIAFVVYRKINRYRSLERAS